MDIELKEKVKILATQLAERNDVLGVNLGENDRLEELNKDYDTKLLEREEYLKDLLMRNEAEINELKFEEASVVERCSHELRVKETNLIQMKNGKNRFIATRDENDVLRKELDRLNEAASKERFASADALHQMNKAMRAKRQNLEASLKRELNDMDLTCQLNAFTSLDEKKKNEMLTNSKLKDELALQSIGMSNLGARLTRQTEHNAKIRGDIEIMERKSKVLRTSLCALHAQAHERQVQFSELKELNSKLKTKLEVILHEESDEAKAIRRRKIIENTLILNEHRLNLKMWQRRLSSMKQFHEDIRLSMDKSLSSHHYTTLNNEVHHVHTGNGQGHESVASDVQSFKDGCDDSSGVTLGVSDIESRYSKLTSCQDDATPIIVPDDAIMTLEKLEWIAKSYKDKCVLEMLNVLKGKEAQIIASKGMATLNKNAVAWVLHELLKIWRETENASCNGFELLSKSISRADTMANIEFSELPTEAPSPQHSPQHAKANADRDSKWMRDTTVKQEEVNPQGLDMGIFGETLEQMKHAYKHLDDDQDLSEVEREGMWDELSKSTVQTAKHGLLLDESSWLKHYESMHTLKKSQSSFIEKLGRSGSVASALNRSGAMKGNSASGYGVDVDTGINVDGYKFTNAIVGEFLPPSASAPCIMLTEMQLNPIPKSKLKSSCKSPVVETDKLFTKPQYQLGIGGNSASLTRLPATNPFSFTSQQFQQQEIDAKRTINVKIKKGHQNLLHKIDKLQKAVSEHQTAFPRIV